MFGSADAAQRRIRPYVAAVLVAGSLAFYLSIVRAMLATSAQLMLSANDEARRIGARRARRVLWSEGAAERAVELLLDEALLALVAPETPQGEAVHGDVCCCKGLALWEGQ